MECEDRRVKYEGSAVILDFPIVPLAVKDCVASREDSYCFQRLQSSEKQRAWLSARECVIDSVRQSTHLKRLKQRIRRGDARLVGELYNATLRKENPLVKKIAREFGLQQRKCVRSAAYKRANLRSYLSLKCCDGQVRKKIRKYLRCERIIRLKTQHKKTLKGIAHTLKISISTTTELWRKIRVTKGQILVKLQNEISNRIALNDFLQQYLEGISDNSETLLKTSRQLYEDARAKCNGAYTFTCTYFFGAFKKFGFQHRSLRYEAKAAKVISGWHLQNFFSVYMFFVFMHRKFRVIFIDESSICPSNFRKRAWRCKGESSVVASAIKYEKLLMLGAMSQTGLVGFQLLHSGFNKEVFANFIVQVVSRQLQLITDNEQLVLFVDNCGSHRQSAMLDFCRKNNVVVLFNLPRRSEFNPIEFLWEYLKRPLRKLVTYSG